MPVLDQWRRFIRAPQSIEFSHMELRARDGEPAIFEGRGEIRFVSTSRFEYTITGRPSDAGYLLRQLKRQRDNPYDALMRFVLDAKDEDGVEYCGGWTVPQVEPARCANSEWTVTGECECLTGQYTDAALSGSGHTEVLFSIPEGYRASVIFRRFVRERQSDNSFAPGCTLEVLGTKLFFSFDDGENLLSISALATDALPLTYTENWLGEPLRILFGQPVYPRLVARVFSDGRAMMWVRPSPEWNKISGWAALWNGEASLVDREGFWSLYVKLLTFIAQSRDDKGQPYLESNKLTQLYEEVIQASHGSRWVWALTFASSIEGLIGILRPRGTKRPNANIDGITSLVAHINQWPGDDGRLRGIAVNAVQRAAEVTASHVLAELVKAGAITATQRAAWETLRNRVMHGSLVSLYSSEEEDGQLLALAELLHALSRQIVS